MPQTNSSALLLITELPQLGRGHLSRDMAKDQKEGPGGRCVCPGTLASVRISKSRRDLERALETLV